MGPLACDHESGWATTGPVISDVIPSLPGSWGQAVKVSKSRGLRRESGSRIDQLPFTRMAEQRFLAGDRCEGLEYMVRRSNLNDPVPPLAPAQFRERRVADSSRLSTLWGAGKSVRIR